MKFLHGENHNQTSGFNYLSWSELVEKVINPPVPKSIDRAKCESEIIAAHDASDKRKVTAIEHDSFTLLRLDLDDTALSINQVTESIYNMGFKSFIVHTTASHKPEQGEYRYRVYIELLAPLNFEQWSAITIHLSRKFNADECIARPQQITYLPYLQDGYERLFVNEGGAFDALNSEMLALSLVEQQAEREELEKHTAKITEPKPINENLSGGRLSLIDLFNKTQPIDEMLTQLGAKKKGGKWLSPETTSGIAGGYTFISNETGNELYYSWSESERAMLGGKPVNAFKLYCLTEGVPANEIHSDVITPAIKEVMNKIGEHPVYQGVTEHNRNIWRKERAKYGN